MRVAVLTAILTLLALLIGGAGAQEPAGFIQTLEHDVRLNRVWTLGVRFETCGINIDQVFLATLDDNGQIKRWQQARTDLIQFQWTRDLANGLGYTIIDLLADFGQKIYLIRVNGSNPLTHGQFIKFYWISPFGISDTYLIKAPVRSNVDEAWKSEEMDHIMSWMLRHRWSHSNLLREFNKLMWKIDARIEIPMKFMKQNCREASLDEDSKEGDLR